MNKVIITGATSMLGVALINKCIDSNIKVVAISRPNSANSNRLPKSDLISVVECDLDNIASLQSIDMDADCMFHLGWNGAQSDKRNDVHLQMQNIKTTIDCVDLCHRARCKAFVMAGSQAEYGRCEGIISTSQPIMPDVAYGVAKYAAGKLSKNLCDSYGIRHIHTRIFSMYGSNDGMGTLVSYLVNNFQSNSPCNLTKCEQLWDYLFCEDCAAAYVAIGNHGKNGAVYNIGSGVARPLKEFVDTIKSISGSSSLINYGAVPYSPIQVMHLEADISSLTRDTRWVPTTTFEAGIKKMLNK